MPSISVRKLKEETIQLLRIQAVNHGVSMEEEVRQIIVRSVSIPEPLGSLAVKLFSPAYKEDAPELPLPGRTIHEPIEFK